MLKKLTKSSYTSESAIVRQSIKNNYLALLKQVVNEFIEFSISIKKN